MNDRVSLNRMIILMCDVIKDKQYDLVTCVNNRDSIFHLAKALATGISIKRKIPFAEVITDKNTKASKELTGKRILIFDDVIYKGTTMGLAIDSCSKQNRRLFTSWRLVRVSGLRFK